MKIKVIKEFIDRKNDMTHRKIGETFEADEWTIVNKVDRTQTSKEK